MTQDQKDQEALPLASSVTVLHRRRSLGPRRELGLTPSLFPSRGRTRQTGQGTLKTLIWQLAECRCSVYSPFSFSLNVSIWTRKGTPFSPPCFRMVNSVLMQWTWGEARHPAVSDSAASG